MRRETTCSRGQGVDQGSQHEERKTNRRVTQPHADVCMSEGGHLQVHTGCTAVEGGVMV
jgi:hypothetical protein